jgi:hypothetical protein
LEGSFEVLLERLPTAERVFVDLHVDTLAAKLYALDAEAKALFGRSFASQLDLATGADDALPGESLKWSVTEQLCYGSVIERIACCRGDLAIGGNLALRNGTNDAAEGVVAGLIFAKGILQDSSLEILRGNGLHLIVVSWAGVYSSLGYIEQDIGNPAQLSAEALVGASGEGFVLV